MIIQRLTKMASEPQHIKILVTTKLQ